MDPQFFNISNIRKYKVTHCHIPEHPNPHSATSWAPELSALQSEFALFLFCL